MESLVNAGVRPIVCVDDCSSERPVFLEKYPAKVVYREKKEGPGAARNSGIVLADGPYVTFVDSDDEVIGDAIGQCVEALERTGNDIALYGAETVWLEDGLKKVDVPDGLCDGEIGPEVVRELYERSLLNCVWGKVYRKSFLEAHGIRFDTTAITGEDLIFNLQCLANHPRWCFVPVVGYRYYRTHTSLLSNYKPSLIAGFRNWNQAWENYERQTPGAREIMNGIGRFSDMALLRMEWRNIWMPRSPYSICARWSWLKSHPEVGGWKLFVKTMMYVTARRNLYVRPIRRWNLKRTFPSVVDL